LEEGEVTKVLVRKKSAQLAQFLGCMLGPVAGDIDLTRNGEVKLFHLCACFQIEHTQAEAVERLFPYLLCIVPRFKHTCLSERFPYIIEFLYQLMIVFLDILILGPLRKSGRLQNFKDQYGVVC